MSQGGVTARTKRVGVLVTLRKEGGGADLVCVVTPLPKQGGGDSLGGRDAPLGTEGGGTVLTARTKRVGVLVAPFEREGGVGTF